MLSGGILCDRVLAHCSTPALRPSADLYTFLEADQSPSLRPHPWPPPLYFLSPDCDYSRELGWVEAYSKCLSVTMCRDT